MHTMALISEILTDEKLFSLNFNNMLSMGWHRKWAKNNHTLTVKQYIIEKTLICVISFTTVLNMLRNKFSGLITVKRILKEMLIAALKNQIVFNLLGKIAEIFSSYSESKRIEIYDSLFNRFQDFTRLPKYVFINNLELVEEFRNIDGDVVECGVWRGGMIAGIASLLGENRSYYLFDSFEGLPEATNIDGQSALDWQADNNVQNCRTDERFAHEAMKLSGVNKFHIVKGWFNQTLPEFKSRQKIAVLRLDADWYSSTAECLNYLYNQVVPNGLIIFDNYYAWGLIEHISETSVCFK
jgi:hypothetical protein